MITMHIGKKKYHKSKSSLCVSLCVQFTLKCKLKKKKDKEKKKNQINKITQFLRIYRKECLKKLLNYILN